MLNASAPYSVGTMPNNTFTEMLGNVGQNNGSNALHEQVRMQEQQIRSLSTTLNHYRNWAATIQARYQMFSPEIIRPSKRTYVGGIPAGTMDGELRQFINELMVKSGGVVAAGFPITSCKVYETAVSADGPEGSKGAVQDKNYAFIEFRSVEEASNCMALDGVAFKDAYLRIRRPNNYDANAALMLGPPDPNPAMDISELRIVRTVVQDSPNKLFVGGLPCEWNEDQVKEMLLPFGTLKAFNLVMDRQTGNSKGYAFCEYNDPGVTDYVIQTLNGKPVGSKFLTVKRALGPVGPGGMPVPAPGGALLPGGGSRGPVGSPVGVGAPVAAPRR